MQHKLIHSDTKTKNYHEAKMRYKEQIQSNVEKTSALWLR